MLDVPGRAAARLTAPRSRRYRARMTDDLTNEATELLQDLIRNACVNDGTVESGDESAAPTCSTGTSEARGLDLERYEPQPGRRSVLAKIEGSRSRPRRR